MSVKKDLTAIYNASDAISGGLFSTIKNSVVNTYKGYFEDKFNDLINKLLNEEITEDYILSWIDNLGPIDKDIYFTILNKNLLSETKIKTFLLSKILFAKMTNDNLDYFHSNLLTNIDLFVEEDFNNFFTLCNSSETNEISQNQTDLKIHSSNFPSLSYQITISKLKSIGILSPDTSYIQEWGTVGFNYFSITENFEKLKLYVNSYYQS